jgi:hypothetical protein
MFNRQAAPASADGQAPASGDATAAAPALEADVVSLHGNATAQSGSTASNSTSAQPPEVFAEIWKDGMKVGVVYTDGQAVLPDRLGGTISSSNGAMFAYMRAQEISQQVGGEVHFVNMPALQVAQTRAQLRSAYGA